jgi:hypothetical protein
MKSQSAKTILKHSLLNIAISIVVCLSMPAFSQSQAFNNLEISYGYALPVGNFASDNNPRKSGFATRGTSIAYSFYKTHTPIGPVTTSHSFGYMFRLAFHSFGVNQSLLPQILNDLNTNTSIFSPPTLTNTWRITELSILGFNINMPLEKTEFDIYSMLGFLIGRPVLYEMEFTNYTPPDFGKFFINEENQGTRNRSNPVGYIWTSGMRMNYMFSRSLGLRFSGELLLGTQGFRANFINTTLNGNNIELNILNERYRQNYASFQFTGGFIVRFN